VLFPTLVFGGCLGIRDWSLAYVDRKLAPKSGDIVLLDPVHPAAGRQGIIKWLEIAADGSYLLRTTDVLFRYNPALHKLGGVVVKIDVAPEGTPAPSRRMERMAVVGEQDNAEFAEDCRASLERKARGIRDDFSECYEPVRMQSQRRPA
jgi:hypothetical protein